jgi:hypothetical protein
MRNLVYLLFPLYIGLFLVCVPTAASAQSADWSALESCARGGFYGRTACEAMMSVPAAPVPGPTPDPIEPAPSPTPAPTSTASTAPTGLVDVGSGIAFSHDGALTEWYTLRLNGNYFAHSSADRRVVEFGALAPGSYAATIEACSDAYGCTRSAPLSLTR